ncbi:Tn3 family transposase [Sphaerisporangium fuscum]|uniref:Tn3 family transposase n=1 Tax=Sphaerisporangium fuscum TaxID=2835868 RepID=UPI001BDBF028|nr:Tn3 family transposase [Sphaerisporangium fuscum]
MNVAHAERQPDRVREELLKQCRAERIEPPSPGRISRIVRSALHNAEQTWFHRIAARPDAMTVARVLALVAADNTAVQTEESDVGGDGDLCLRILQASLVMVNVLMLQDVLSEPEWSALLTPVDRRGLTPLFRLHIRPYGEVRLDLSARLSSGTLGSLGST